MLKELPQRMTTAEEKEILSLLCKVHELEIDKVRWQIFQGSWSWLVDWASLGCKYLLWFIWQIVLRLVGKCLKVYLELKQLKEEKINFNQVEMKSETLLKSHEVRRRDLLILKYVKLY